MQLVVTENIYQIQNQLTALYAKMDDVTPLMQDIAMLLEGSTKERFITKTDPKGDPWEKLSDLTIALKGNAEILTDTSRLVDSITSFATGSSAVVGTNTIYAPTHQFGATITPKNGTHLKFGNNDTFVSLQQSTIPARPFLGISQQDEEDIIDLIHQYITE